MDEANSSLDFFSNTYYDTKWIKILADNSCPVSVKVGIILIWRLTHIRPMLYCLDKLIDSCTYASFEVVKTNVFLKPFAAIL